MQQSGDRLIRREIKTHRKKDRVTERKRKRDRETKSITRSNERLYINVLYAFN